MSYGMVVFEELHSEERGLVGKGDATWSEVRHSDDEHPVKAGIDLRTRQEREPLPGVR
jgi:hypothetical protein